jgi:hypothetical protein
VALTFKSSRPVERVLIERGSDGAQRVCKARQTDYNPKMWNLTLEHPSGMTWKGTFHGDGNNVNIALAQLLVDKENDYREEAARGHKPRPAPLDCNIPVADMPSPHMTTIRRYTR